MIIYGIPPEGGAGVRYYKHTNEGRPIFAGKADAADLFSPQLEVVLSHLQIMRPGWRVGATKREERFKRRKPDDAA